jgi:uncharacterized protein
VVMVDLRRVDDCFPAIDFFENRRMPFVVAINEFDESEAFTDDHIRESLVLPPDCPVVRLDAREASSCKAALVALVEHALARSAR